MMKIITKTLCGSLSLLAVSSLLTLAAGTAFAKSADVESRLPTGCKSVGFKHYLKALSLFPGDEGAKQSMYFIFNKLSQPVNLYEMRDKESEFTARLTHAVHANSWAVLAASEPEIKFACALGDGKSAYGKVVDCAEAVTVCEYVNVKFGLNNKGNFWIVNSNTRNGAINEVVRYGIIPGV